MSRQIQHGYVIALDAIAKKEFKMKRLEDKVNLQAKAAPFTGGPAVSQQGGVPESLSSSHRKDEVTSFQVCSARRVSMNRGLSEPWQSGDLVLFAFQST